jgi:hypothetical protein
MFSYNRRFNLLLTCLFDPGTGAARTAVGGHYDRARAGPDPTRDRSRAIGHEPAIATRELNSACLIYGSRQARPGTFALSSFRTARRPQRPVSE